MKFLQKLFGKGPPPPPEPDGGVRPDGEAPAVPPVEAGAVPPSLDPAAASATLAQLQALSAASGEKLAAQYAARRLAPPFAVDPATARVLANAASSDLVAKAAPAVAGTLGPLGAGAYQQAFGGLTAGIGRAAVADLAPDPKALVGKAARSVVTS